MTDVNHTENLINYLRKIGESGKVKECAYSVGDRIFVRIVHERGKLECDEPFCTEKVRSLHMFITKMFVI